LNNPNSALYLYFLRYFVYLIWDTYLSIVLNVCWLLVEVVFFVGLVFVFRVVFRDGERHRCVWIIWLEYSRVWYVRCGMGWDGMIGGFSGKELSGYRGVYLSKSYVLVVGVVGLNDEQDLHRWEG